MDPLTIGVSTALTYSADKVYGLMIKDSYENIKKWIFDKLGLNNPVSTAIQALESNPDSQGRQLVLHEEVIQTGLHQDPEMARLIAKLQAALDKVQPTVINQTTINVGSAVGSQVAHTIHNN